MKLIESWRRDAPSTHLYKSQKVCAYCGACGTRLYHAGGNMRVEGRTILSMKAGTLDDTSVVSPTCHIWTKRAQPWLKPLLERNVCFETEPDSDDALRAKCGVTAGSASGQSGAC